jgi:hypothetical protein
MILSGGGGGGGSSSTAKITSVRILSVTAAVDPFPPSLAPQPAAQTGSLPPDFLGHYALAPPMPWSNKFVSSGDGQTLSAASVPEKSLRDNVD